MFNLKKSVYLLAADGTAVTALGAADDEAAGAALLLPLAGDEPDGAADDDEGAADPDDGAADVEEDPLPHEQHKICGAVHFSIARHAASSANGTPEVAALDEQLVLAPIGSMMATVANNDTRPMQATVPKMPLLVFNIFSGIFQLMANVCFFVFEWREWKELVGVFDWLELLFFFSCSSSSVCDVRNVRWMAALKYCPGIWPAQH